MTLAHRIRELEYGIEEELDYYRRSRMIQALKALREEEEDGRGDEEGDPPSVDEA